LGREKGDLGPQVYSAVERQAVDDAMVKLVFDIYNSRAE